MKRLAAVLVAVALAVMGPLRLHAEEQAPGNNGDILQQIDRAIVGLFSRVAPSVVQITTFAKGKTEADSQIRTGSGFFWDDQGHVITNAHVVRGADEIAVWLDTGQQFEAEVVGVAPNFDLAVVRAKGLAVPRQAIPVGSSSDLRVGQSVFVIGSPFGLDQSLTAGVVSSLKRVVPTSQGRSISNVIQIDASVHPGSSGGPLLDSSGRLIGINTIAYAIAELGTSFGFAIPVDTVKRVVPVLIRDGRIATPGIGIVPAKEDIAIQAGVDGVIIAEVKQNTPAAQAGLRPTDESGKLGDVIVSANGKTVRNVYEFTDQLEEIGAGGEIALKIQRDGKTIDLTVAVIDIDQKS